MRLEPFAGNAHGWQVDANAFQRVLLDSAISAGVRVEHRRLQAIDDETLPQADLVLDCTGRSGLHAKARGLRVYEPQHRTVALVAAWRRDDGWPVPDATHTLIESYEDGWVWSVPLSDGTRHIAVMVDPQKSNLARGQSSSDVYAAELAKTRQFTQLIRNATMCAGPSGWDASMYYATQYCSDNTLMVGDAGSFIDPLSSAGVKKALASGWLAAVVTHTSLVRPAMRETALRFFDARETEVYGNFRRLTQRYLADAARGYSHAFWEERASPQEEDTLSADSLRSDPGVLAALSDIREAPILRLQRAPAVRIESRPAVSGNEIVLEPRLVVDERPQGIRYLHDVDVVTLIELAPGFTQVPDLFDAYCRQTAPVSIADFVSALATAIGKRWLISAPK